jgi:hypothetical protein
VELGTGDFCFARALFRKLLTSQGEREEGRVRGPPRKNECSFTHGLLDSRT